MKLVDFLSQPDQLRAYAKIQGEISVPDSVTARFRSCTAHSVRCSNKRRR